MRSASRGSASRFVSRLAELVEGDGHDPDVAVASDETYFVDEDGRLSKDSTGAEAILIVRGPVEGRRTAIDRLLAVLKR
jgi:hypothetical protein